jgi:molybdopterin converting factor small subunit
MEAGRSKKLDPCQSGETDAAATKRVHQPPIRGCVLPRDHRSEWCEQIAQHFFRLRVVFGQDDFMKILFFAQSRQASGCDEYVLKTDETLTQPEFWALLIEIFPGLAAQQKAARLARQETYLENSDLLHPGDKIAVIPPVSGG